MNFSFEFLRYEVGDEARAKGGERLRMWNARGRGASGATAPASLITKRRKLIDVIGADAKPIMAKSPAANVVAILQVLSRCAARQPKRKSHFKSAKNANFQT